jgi:hypothetical protein
MRQRHSVVIRIEECFGEAIFRFASVEIRGEPARCKQRRIDTPGGEGGPQNEWGEVGGGASTEMGAAYLCAESGISRAMIENSFSLLPYLQMRPL